MPMLRAIQEATQPAADALRLLLSCGSELPPAGVALSPTENAFVWLSRLAVDAAWNTGGSEDDPESTRQRLSDSLTKAFGPGAEAAFPLLVAARRNTDRGGSNDNFAKAARAMRRLDPAGIDHDLLGELYEAHLDRTDGGPSGQHFTPRPVADLLLSRVSKVMPYGRMYDPAMGTGRFLVGHLRRARAEGASRADLIDSVAGSELSRVSHCLAQANLLLQVAAEEGRGILPIPRLMLENSLWALGDGPSAEHEICCANPPYVGERRNKSLFDRLMREIPSLTVRRAPRMDLFYYFAELCLEVTRPGGVIALLTTAYWLTADGASGLRERLHDRAAVLEIVDFGEQRLFGSAGGQHNLAILLRRRSNDASHAGDQPMAWARVRTPGPLEETCARVEEALNEAHSRGGPIESLSVTAGVGEMVRPEGPAGVWHIPVGRRREQVLEAIAAAGVQLGSLAKVSQGLISGADRVTPANSDRLPKGAMSHLGQGIFVLTPEELAAAGIPDTDSVVRPFIKNSEIERYAMTTSPRLRLLYLDDTADLSLHPAVLQHLRRYRALLAARREVAMGAIPWWRLHWPRGESMFEAPKVMCPHRARANAFAYVPQPLYASADAYYLWGLGPDELTRLTGILNSSIADFWFAHRGKRKGNQREYYATPLRGIPVPHPARRESARVARLVDRAPLDYSITERVTWAAEKGDWGAADTAIRRVSHAIIELRLHPTGADLHEIALEVVEERRLESLLDVLVAIRYGLYGKQQWMHEVVVEARGD